MIRQDPHVRRMRVDTRMISVWFSNCLRWLAGSTAVSVGRMALRSVDPLWRMFND